MEYLFLFRKYTAAFYAVLEATFTPKFAFSPKIVDTMRTFFTKRIVAGLGAKVEVFGTLENDTDLIIANHQSQVDIFMIEQVVGNDTRFVGRKGIMDKWPTSVMVDFLGHITIDLEDKRSIIHLIKEVKKNKGKKIIIFPEGTRQNSGKIENFEAGAKLLADKLDLKVQGCVINNMLGVYNEHDRTAKKGTITITFLPPVTKEENWFEKLHQAMQEKFLAYTK